MPGYWLCPLYCFNCETDVVTFEWNVQITKISQEFHQFLFEESDSTFFRTPPCESEWVISIPQEEVIQAEKTVEGRLAKLIATEEKVKNLTVDLITALRMSKAGRVIPGLLMSASIPAGVSPSFGGTTVWTSLSSLDFFVEDPQYVFGNNDLTPVKTVFKEIANWREAGILNQLEIPLYRFHSAYLGPIEERLVDQIIAFESLYLGDPQELSYKLAMRTAYSIGSNKEERIAIFNNVKKAYEFRSKIIHGNDPPTRDRLRVMVPILQEYLRKSLKKYFHLLDQGNKLKQIQQKILDDSILEGGYLTFSPKTVPTGIRENLVN